MLLQELYQRLSVGFFSNLSIGKEGAGDLTDKGKTATKVHLNAALRALASRFTLAEDVLILQLLIGQTRYDLTPEHAMTNQTLGEYDGPFYIVDNIIRPFTGPVLAVTRVYKDNGDEFSINEPDNPQSIYTPKVDQLQVPTGTGAGMLAINYKTLLPEIAFDAPDETVVDIPTILEDPIALFIAAQMYANMNGQEHLARSQTMMVEYEARLAGIEANDLLGNSYINVPKKFYDRGFC